MAQQAEVGGTAGAAAGTTIRVPRMRRVIASRMTESLRIAAQLTAVQEADVSGIRQLRERAKEAFKDVEDVPLTYLPFFARALVQAAGAHPAFNASLDQEGNHVTYHDAVHLGIAVETDRGLVVPVLRDAQAMTLRDIAVGISGLAERARSGRIGPDEISGSTITLTNIGSAGSLSDTPIINYPEVAILGTGAIVRRPRVNVSADGRETVEIRSVCSLPLTYDHRLIDGADAGRFLSFVRARLDPAEFEAELAPYLG